MAAALLLCGLVAYQVYASGILRIDDAYITFSFSKNLASGNGPVYSHGVRVEGYSNFLWMVLNALPLAIDRNLDPYVGARLLALPFFALLLLATYGLARARLSRLWAFLTVLLLALHSDIIWAFLSGLETLPYTALITAAFACQVAPRGWRRRRLAVPFMTAAALMRIDGFVPLGFLLGWELFESLLDRRGLAPYLRQVLPWVALYLLWFTWRWWYYGLPLPSTYYAKALFHVMDKEAGWNYAGEELAATGVLVMVPFLILLLHRLARPVWLLVFYAAGHTAYVIRVGGDWMPFSRFFVPIVPIVYVLCVWAVVDVAARARALRIWPRLHHVLAVLLGLGALGRVAIYTNNPWGKPDARTRDRMGMAVGNAEHVASLRRAAELLNLVVPSGKRLVTDYAGVIAYYTDAAIIDMWGLCNAMIATRGNADGIRPMYGRTCHACYPELGPDYFHTETPWLRAADALGSHEAVLHAVWQMDSIQRYLDVRSTFRSGRIIDRRDGQALFFLERRDGPPPARHLPAWASLDYPFGS